MFYDYSGVLRDNTLGNILSVAHDAQRRTGGAKQYEFSRQVGQVAGRAGAGGAGSGGGGEGRGGGGGGGGGGGRGGGGGGWGAAAAADFVWEWEQRLDPTHNIHYYYNLFTQESAWEPPEGGFKPM